MSTIKFTSNFAGSILPNANYGIFSTTSASTAYLISGSNSSTSQSLLLIYSGDVPDLSQLSDRASRDSDLLISFSIPGSSNGFTVQSLADRYNVTIGKCPTPTSAIKTGIASWFLLCRSGTTSLTDKGSMLGTVGLPGSGADLLVPDTNIILGNLYQSSGFTISFPNIWDI